MRRQAGRNDFVHPPRENAREIWHKLAMDIEGDDDCKRAAEARKGSPFLNTAQAAHYLGLSERKLEAMRISGEGPAYRKHATCVRYHIKDLELWSDTTKRISTHTVDDDAPQS